MRRQLGDMAMRSRPYPATEDEKRVLTFYNYVHAWWLNWNYRYPGGRDAARQAQESAPGFRALQGGTEPTPELRAYLERAWLTLKAMRDLPVEERPALALSANLWLPVQAYFAAHAAGLATLEALSAPPVKDHTAFLSAASQEFCGRSLLPPPFTSRCIGDPAANAEQFVGLAVSSEQARSMHNLATPTVDNSEQLIAKSLRTTRQNQIQERLPRLRKQLGRERLPASERERTTARHRDTSIFCLLYRMRIRSNYDEADMYVRGQWSPEVAMEHYRRLLELTEWVIDALEQIIARKIGQEVLLGFWEKFAASF